MGLLQLPLAAKYSDHYTQVPLYWQFEAYYMSSEYYCRTCDVQETSGKFHDAMLLVRC